MTKITSRLLEDSFEIDVIGHANYDEYGKDIVCSAVSILTFSLHKYLLDALDKGRLTTYRYTFEDGAIRLNCGFKDSTVKEGIKSILGGYEILAENYEKNASYSPKGISL